MGNQALPKPFFMLGETRDMHTKTLISFCPKSTIKPNCKVLFAGYMDGPLWRKWRPTHLLFGVGKYSNGEMGYITMLHKLTDVADGQFDVIVIDSFRPLFHDIVITNHVERLLAKGGVVIVTGICSNIGVERTDVFIGEQSQCAMTFPVALHSYTKNWESMLTLHATVVPDAELAKQGAMGFLYVGVKQ